MAALMAIADSAESRRRRPRCPPATDPPATARPRPTEAGDRPQSAARGPPGAAAGDHPQPAATAHRVPHRGRPCACQRAGHRPAGDPAPASPPTADSAESPGRGTAGRIALAQTLALAYKSRRAKACAAAASTSAR
jgi:hypothetical protein